MDYHHPYNVYPEYYCPPYGAAGHGYHSNGTFPHQPHPAAGNLRNFNNAPVNHTAQHHQPQQHPHHFMSPYHHQQHSNYSTSSSSSMFVPNFLVSSGTGLTPTLTPTTLANLESSFIELQSGGRDPVTQSGFVPPVVDTANSADHSQDSYQSSSDAEWEPTGKMARYNEGIKGIDYIVTSTGTINATPQRKYTRRNKDEKLPPEEEEKRRVRRERNKLAAAKCRQRRVDHTNELVEETEKLEAEQSKLESEIQKLQQERDQLEFVLQAHQPVCKVHKVKVKVEDSTPHHKHLSTTACPTPENLTSKSTTATSSVTANSSTISSSVASSRPNSLPLIKRDRARMLSMTSATGVTINTPTSGVTITPSSLFCPGLDSMVDGSTGLTPLTSMSCSSQVNHRGGESNSENVGSPTLISL